MNTTKSNTSGNNFNMDGKSDGQTKEPKGNFSNNLNENLNESSKAFEKGFGDINANVMDMYNKQMHLLTGFYNNYFSPIMGHTKDWNIGQGFGNNFFGGNLTKMFSNPFMSMNTGFSNPFLLSFDKMYKQMMGGNNNLFSDFTGQMQGSKMDINETGRKYLEAIENQIETSKHIFNSLNEIYGNNINSSVETNKKLTEEIGKQFSLIIKQNQKIWADILDAYRMPVNGESKNSKEPTSAESKKKADAPIAA